MAGHVLPIVELAAIDNGLDLVCLVDVKNIGVGPPGGGDDVFHDPGEGLGSFGLASFRPIPGSNGQGHGYCSNEVLEV